MKRKSYEKELRKLQVQLCHFQQWVREKRLRVLILFEGRDAAGKGGTIKAITEKSARGYSGPWPFPRHQTGKRHRCSSSGLEHFPAGGEVVIFDRSWYNRAGVEYVMGLCSPEEHRRFLSVCPQIEKYIVDGGILLIKIWLEVGMEEQERRFRARIDDPVRQWKLSPMDLESYKRWYEFSEARDLMFKATSTKHAPWHIIRSDDKRRARLNCMAHLCSQYRSSACRTSRFACRNVRLKADSTIRPRFAEPRSSMWPNVIRPMPEGSSVVPQSMTI
jgi:polyphosphate kinase 2